MNLINRFERRIARILRSVGELNLKHLNDLEQLAAHSLVQRGLAFLRRGAGGAVFVCA